MEGVFDYTLTQKNKETIDKLLLLAELVLFEDEREITQPIHSIVEGYFRDMAKSTHEEYKQQQEAIEEYQNGVGMVTRAFDITREDFEAVKYSYHEMLNS